MCSGDGRHKSHKVRSESLRTESRFFYALLEKKSWRGDEEILGEHGDYRDRFMLLSSEEYEAILRQQQGRHEPEVSFSQAYDEIVTALMETINIDVQEIVAMQLRTMRPRGGNRC
jgi:hypothetical protein